jgi:hypothetical protein
LYPLALTGPYSCEPPSLGDAEELTSLMAAAGFEGLDLRAETGAVRFASVARFVASYVAGSPLAGPVAASPPEARDALLAEVAAKLEPLAGDELDSRSRRISLAR